LREKKERSRGTHHIFSLSRKTILRERERERQREEIERAE
jgi:heme exporter protein D